jgi:hypothetical protein
MGEVFMIIDKLDYFGRYEHYLQGRYPTMRIALNLLHQKESEPMILETGCMRGFQDWGAGMSTYLFAEFVHKFGGYFHSVDISEENKAVAEYACQGLPANIHLGDSLEFLRNWDKGKIDLLYLDSMDMGDTVEQAKKSAYHQLSEMELAFPKLNDSSIVLLDDTNFLGAGKAKLTRAFLESKGFVEVYNYQQSLWLMF